MAKSESIDPEAEDFAAAETVGGRLCEENGSPTEARVRYEAAQAHKLLRVLKGMAQRIPQPGAARPRSKKRSRD